MATPQTQSATASAPPPLDFSDLGATPAVAGGGNEALDFSDLGAKAISAPPKTASGPPGFFKRLGQSLGLPTSKEELEAQQPPSIPEILGGPAVAAGKAFWNYGKNAVKGLGEAYQETKEGGENIAAGQPVMPNVLGKGLLPGLRAGINAIPFIGPSINTAGEDVASKNYSGAAGGLTGVIGQLAAASTPGEAAIEKGTALVKSAPEALATAGGAIADTARSAYGIANPEALTAEQSATKAIKPRNSKVNWKQDVNSALPDVRRAIDNSGIDLSTATLDDIDQATTRAKKDVWGEYEDKFTGPNQKATVDATPVADTIRGTVSQRTLEQNPTLADHIETIAKTYDGRQLSVADLEDRITELNGETRGIEARYPADKSAAKALPENAPVFAERNALRNLLISKLDEVEGPGAQDLRSRYGALSSFQDVLQRRKAVYERANPESLGEQIGRFAGVGQMVRGAGRMMGGDVISGGADIAAGAAMRAAAKAGKRMNDSQFLLRQALNKTEPRPSIIPRVSGQYVAPPESAQLGGIARFLPSGVYEQPAGNPPAEPLQLEHMQPAESEYVPEPQAPPARIAGMLPRGVYHQPGGFEPNLPALPPYRGIPLGPSRLDAAEANAPATVAPRSTTRPPLEPEPGAGARQAEPLPNRVSAAGANQPQRPIQSQTGGNYGSPTQVLTSGANLPGKYKVVEADDLIPSHDSGTFAQRPDYPAGVQERTYHSSKEAQARVIQQAQNYDPNYTVNTNPDAINGPPIVTKDGIVLGGNSRTMSTQRLYAAGRGDVYKNELLRQAGTFGLDPSVVSAMGKPVLVREVSTPQGGIEGMRKLGSDLNKSMTGALSVEERAVSAGRSVSPQTFDSIGQMRDHIGEDATLRDVLRKNGRQVLDLLQRDGAVTDRERPQLVNTSTGGLSEEGKNLVERSLLGSVVDDPVLMQRTPRSVLDRVGNSLADITKLAGREDEYNILPLLREALADHAELAMHGSNLETYLGQQGMFGQQRSPAVDAMVRTLAKRPQQARLAFRQFAQDATFNQPGQSLLALAEPPSAAKSFNDAFGANINDEQLIDAIRESMLKEAPRAPASEIPLAARQQAQSNAVEQAKQAVRTGNIDQALSFRDAARRPELEPAELLNKDTRDLHQKNGSYTPERQALHQQLIAQTGVGRNLQKADPTLTLLGGGAASGKSHLAQAAAAKYPDAVRLDSDAFKAGLPEYPILQQSDPLGAAQRVHEESSDITKQAINEARNNRHDIILDAVSGKANQTAELLDRFRQAGYRIEAHFADRPVNEALEGMAARFENTGRWVPPDLLAEGHVGAARTFQHIAPTVDESSLSMAKPGGGHMLVYKNGNIYNKDAYETYRAKGAELGRSGNHAEVPTAAR